MCIYILQIRGMSIQKALVQTEFSDKKVATFVKEVSVAVVYNELKTSALCLSYFTGDYR